MKREKYLLLLLLALVLSSCGSAASEDPEEKPETEVLVYAVLSSDGYDREVVSSFNRTHQDVKIEIADYSETEGGRSGKERLLTEIMAGRVPDIIDFRGDLPYRQLAKKGYLEDLWPYIEADPNLGRDSVKEAPLNAAGVDGGLYMAFNKVHITTLVGPTALVGDRSSWSMEDLKTAFAAMPEGSTVLEYVYDKFSTLYYILPMILDSYVDWDTGTCSFDRSEFRDTLEFINRFPDPDLDWSHPEEINEELTSRLANGRQLLSHVYITNFRDMRIYDKTYEAVFGGRSTFIGFPVSDGSVGSSFRIGSARLAMSASCRNKEAAWDFLRQMFLPQFTETRMDEVGGLPINCADFKQLKDYYMAYAPFEPTPINNYSSFSVKLDSMTGAEYERFMAFYNSIEKIAIYDDFIFEIVQEVCAPYFAGDKTLDGTAQLLNNRVSLYVNEQR